MMLEFTVGINIAGKHERVGWCVLRSGSDGTYPREP
jgi:hypothetical protein